MDNKYAGMTVNERLYVSGLMGEFDEAVKQRNSEKVRAILEKVELNGKQLSRNLYFSIPSPCPSLRIKHSGFLLLN